jgi:hypothetical protein
MLSDAQHKPVITGVSSDILCTSSTHYLTQSGYLGLVEFLWLLLFLIGLRRHLTAKPFPVYSKKWKNLEKHIAVTFVTSDRTLEKAKNIDSEPWIEFETQ